jgi:hypothetical protein
MSGFARSRHVRPQTRDWMKPTRTRTNRFATVVSSGVHSAYGKADLGIDLWDIHRWYGRWDRPWDRPSLCVACRLRGPVNGPPVEDLAKLAIQRESTAERLARCRVWTDRPNSPKRRPAPPSSAGSSRSAALGASHGRIRSIRGSGASHGGIRSIRVSPGTGRENLAHGASRGTCGKRAEPRHRGERNQPPCPGASHGRIRSIRVSPGTGRENLAHGASRGTCGKRAEPRHRGERNQPLSPGASHGRIRSICVSPGTGRENLAHGASRGTCGLRVEPRNRGERT